MSAGFVAVPPTLSLSLSLSLFPFYSLLRSRIHCTHDSFTFSSHPASFLFLSLVSHSSFFSYSISSPSFPVEKCCSSLLLNSTDKKGFFFFSYFTRSRCPPKILRASLDLSFSCLLAGFLSILLLLPIAASLLLCSPQLYTPCEPTDDILRASHSLRDSAQVHAHFTLSLFYRFFFYFVSLF